MHYLMNEVFRLCDGLDSPHFVDSQLRDHFLLPKGNPSHIKVFFPRKKGITFKFLTLLKTYGCVFLRHIRR